METKHSDLIATVSKLKTTYETQLVYITPNVSYQMNDIINLARKNYVGQFDNPTFPSGHPKVWPPLTETIVKTVRKELQIKPSDFQWIPLRHDTFGLVRMLKYATMAQLRRVKFPEFIKRVKERITVDGSAVIKFTDKYSDEYKRRVINLEIKDWFNVLFDHTANSFDETPVLERVIMPIEEAHEMKGWKFEEDDEGTMDPRYFDPQNPLATPSRVQSQEPKFVGWYVWMNIPKAWIKEFNGETPEAGDYKKRVQGVVVASRLGEMWKDEEGNSHDATKIHYVAESPYKKNGKPVKPYKMIRYEHLMGRLPGRGVAEALFDLQLYLNNVINVRYFGNMLRNTVLMFFNPARTGLRPGDLERLGPTGMVPMNKLTDEDVKFAQIPPSADTYNEQSQIGEMAQRVSGATDSAQAATPASQSATGTVLDSQYTQSSFQETKESISLDFAALFEDLIIPFVIDNLDDEEILTVTGDMDDVEEFDETVLRHHVSTEALKFVETTGKVPTEEEIDAEVDRLKETFRKSNRYIKDLASFKKDLQKLEYQLELSIADDTLPVETLITQIKEVMQMIPPENMQTVQIDANKVFGLIFDRLGIRYESLTSAKKQQMQQQPQAQQEQQPQQATPSPEANQFIASGVNPVAGNTPKPPPALNGR